MINQKMTTEYISDIAQGKGGLKYYSYWATGGIKILSKKDIRLGISMQLTIYRTDKIMNIIERFCYKDKRFKFYMKK